jgi:[acyl-carrier-protein] S-malonyltransferase
VVRRLLADGVRTFVEMGPGTVLTGLIRKIDGSAAAMSIENSQGLDRALATLNPAGGQ